LDGKKLLLGEAKTRVPSVAGAKAVLAAKAVPLSGEVVRVLFVAEGEGGEGVITGRRLLGL
jgi:hypothetical protein